MIRQNLLPDNDKQSFYWFLWHELGHWYTRNTEPDDLRRYSNPNLLDAVTLSDRLRGVNTTITQLKQDGYWFWQEFIAEAISQYVYRLHRTLITQCSNCFMHYEAWKYYKYSR